MNVSNRHVYSQIAANKPTTRIVSLLLLLPICAVVTSVDQPACDAEQITKGPVLLGVYQNRAALMWETTSQQSCKLNYGIDEKLSDFVESKGQRVEYTTTIGSNEQIKNTVFIHKVWLENLQPGQIYNYRITSQGFQDKLYGFRTAPAHTDQVKFIVYGDNRTNAQVHRQLIKQMIKEKVDFVVNCGDLVYNGDKYEQWGTQFFTAIKGLAESVPLYIAKGNHEGTTGNYEKLLAPPGRSNTFAFDYGPVHFFCADNSNYKNTDANDVLRRISADLDGSQAAWNFVTYHVPSVNFAAHWSAWGYPNMLPRLAAMPVDFVITGHSHLYERFRPVAPPTQGNGSYVTYITTGGGGAPLKSIKKSDFHAAAASTYHFCLFTIDGNKLTMNTIDRNGKTIDHLQITKTDGRLNQEYLGTAVPLDQLRQFQQANLHRQN
jgi:predicted phosphodiesterase